MDEARRLHYLDAMGITAWRLRDGPASARHAEPMPAAASASSGEPPTAASTGPATPPARTETPPGAPRTPGTAPAPMPQPLPGGQPAPEPPSSAGAPPRDEPPPWTDDDLAGLPRDDAIMPPPDLYHDQTPAATPPNPIAAMDWPALKAAVGGCRACGLCERRTNTVFGVGNEQAELMFVGEGPGQDEDRKGEPFIGRAGQLLNRMLAAVELDRAQVYIANIVKCRPPNNRNPTPDEAAACRAFLERQIALIRPRLIVSLGAVSADNLLGTTDSVGRLRGRSHRFQPADGSPPIPLIVTYHPSYYLRSPAEKAKGWQDLQRIIRMLRSRD